MDENRRSKPARCERNGEETESKERRFRNPWKGETVLDIPRGGPSSRKSGVWMRIFWRFGKYWRKVISAEKSAQRYDKRSERSEDP